MRAALGFLTVLGRRRATPAPDGGTMRWFPLIGAGIGTVVGLVHWAVGARWSALVAAVVAVTADAVVTGFLHLDGVADSADGLLPHMSRERRLAVMAAPDIGAFGVVVLVLTLLARVGAVASLDGDAATVATLAALWAASRTVMAAGALASPYVGGGLASAFLGGSWTLPAGIGALVAGASAAIALAFGGSPAGVLVGLVAGLAAGAGVLALGRRRLGGVSGDVLGAAGVAVETVGVLLVSARW